MKENYCVTCGEKITDALGKNITTHEGDCRQTNKMKTRSFINDRVKKERTLKIITFLEMKFSRGINMERISEDTATFKIHNISFSDFIFTYYYFATKETTPVSIKELNKAAIEWITKNEPDRLEKDTVKKRERIEKLKINKEKMIDDAKKFEIESVIKKLESSIEKKSRFGYSKKAASLITKKRDFNFLNNNEIVISMIKKVSTDECLEEEKIRQMIEIHDSIREKTFGRSPNVIASGIFYHVCSEARKIDKTAKKINQDRVARLFGISTPSLRDICILIKSNKNGEHVESVV